MKPLVYNHSRFDGGMTHNKRDTSDLTKLGFISHLDIYRDRNAMYVMPGYVSDSSIFGDPNGLKLYDVRAFGDIGSADVIYALGTKSDGTGSKIFERDLAGSEWRVPTTNVHFAVEGSNNLTAYPFMYSTGTDFYYPVQNAGTTKVAQHGLSAAGNYNGTWQNWLSTVTTGRTDMMLGFDNVTYLTKGGQSSGISSISSGSVVATAKSTGLSPSAIATGNYTIGIVGTSNIPRRSNLLIWGAASLLADQNASLGKGTAVAVGNPSGVWAVVTQSAFRDLEANGQEEMVVRALSGENVETLYRLPAVSGFTTWTDMFSLNDQYRDAMLWYGRIETAPGEYTQGVFALGKSDINSQFGVSLLLDTSALGVVESARLLGFSTYFAHNNDGSVSRLDNFATGAYDVPATIETLIYGSDIPFALELNGVSLTTENLPSGASVQCFYRTDENNAWTDMGTSNTANRQKHNFTKNSDGTPIGKFEEIQFKFVITGKVTVKNIMVKLTPNADLSF